MELKVVNQLEINRWRDFVDRHPEGNIFHSPEMFHVYADTRGYKPSLWAVVDQQQNILALHTPVHITLMGGFLHYFTTRNVNFGSVLVQDGEIGREALALLLKFYNRHVSRVPLFTELRNSSDLSDLQDILQAQGYKYKKHLNYFVNINRDEYDILQSFSRSARKDIRAVVRKRSVVVKDITDPALLPLFFELIKMTYTNAKIPLADFSLFQSAFSKLVPNNMARFTIAFVNGAPASAAVNLLYKDVVYGWYNGGDRSFRSYYPNEYIIWDSMRWGSMNGYKVFDFGGAGSPDKSSPIRDFKLKFRGDLVEYGRNICIHNPFRMNLAERVYKLGRKMAIFGKS